MGIPGVTESSHTNYNRIVFERATDIAVETECPVVIGPDSPEQWPHRWYLRTVESTVTDNHSEAPSPAIR